MDKKILLVEDDEYLRDGLCELLNTQGYAVAAAKTAAETGKLLSRDFSLIILDVMLPDGNGFDLCADIRKKEYKTPILFLTACDDEYQIVRGLDSGADDYVTKPFRLQELLSRVRALLRRAQDLPRFSSGCITVDEKNMTVKKDGKVIILTKTEYLILMCLMRNSPSIVTRSQLLEIIWDDGGNFVDDNTLSVHMSRLREKIGVGCIKTIRGVGYRWEEQL